MAHSTHHRIFVMTRFYDWYENLPGDKRALVFFTILCAILIIPMIGAFAATLIYGSSLTDNGIWARGASIVVVTIVGATRIYYSKVTCPRRRAE
jgi:hypothetical protein